MELAQLAYDPQLYECRNVVTRGTLFVLPRSVWGLRDGAAQVLIVPMPGLGEESVRDLVDRRVEVTGVARLLPMSQCTDPGLPALPDARPEWPRVSLTAVSVFDAEAYRRPEGRRRAATIGAALADPAARAGKSVRVVGRFRGANLFGDLPADSRRDPGDWVLMDGDHALWVTGRPPRGKGFDLDPGRKSDTGRWLEVEGKLEAGSGIAYLKASRVQLVARPAPPE